MFGVVTKWSSSYRVSRFILLWSLLYRAIHQVTSETSALRPNPPHTFNRAQAHGHYQNPDLSPATFTDPRHGPQPISRYRGCDTCTYGGHNATCVRVSGIFTRPTLPDGYNVITRIPQGACSLEVSEMRLSKNYLALRDEKGTYVVNGRWNIDRSGHYAAAGTTFTYRRHDLRRNRGESLTAPGPLTEPILLLVIYQEPNQGISYEYSLPLDASASRHQPALLMPPALEYPVSFNPEAGSTSPPDVRRHHRRHRTHTHRSPRLEPPPPSNDATLTDDLSPSMSFPSGFDPPKRTIGQTPPVKKPGRGKTKKTYRWQVLDDTLTECSVTCGKGFQTQLAVCVRVGAKESSGQFHTVDERHCRGQAKPILERLVCNSNVPCQPASPGNRGPTRPKPPTIDNKIPYSETGMVWKPEEWGPCSASCGTGVRTRLVTCVDLSPVNSRSVYQDERCNELYKPPDSEACYATPCAPTWLVSSWDIQCDETCGPDLTRKRRVICSDQLPAEGDPADDPKRSRNYYEDVMGNNVGKCDRRKRPRSEESCHSVLRVKGVDCSHVGQWMSGDWSQCSSTCGVPGWQTRSVVCLVQQRVASTDSCHGQEEPVSRQPCNPGVACHQALNEVEANEIPGVWFTSEWRNCSSPCGGTQDRDVICLSLDSRVVVQNCPQEERPQHKRSCNAYEGEDGKKCDEILCIDKDPHCHLVARARLCSYEHYRTRCCHSCEQIHTGSNHAKRTVS